MKTKKILAILLCLIMLMGYVVGCTSSNNQNDDNNSPNANLGHKHTIVAIAGNVYLVTLEYSNKLVSKVNFYSLNAFSLLNDQIMEFGYDEGGKIKEATIFGVSEGKKQPISDSFDVKYKESGELEYLSFTSNGEPYVNFTAINKDGNFGYEISDDSDDKSIVLIGENGLTQDITAKNCDATIKYDKNDRISECKSKSDSDSFFGDSTTFEYEGDNCCFSKVTAKSGEMAIDVTVDRNEKHQITFAGWKYDELGFVNEYTYKYTDDGVQLVLSLKEIMDDGNRYFTYTYDDNDRLVESVESQEARNGKIVVIEKFNEKGILIYQSYQEEYINRDGVTRRWYKNDTIFDENGKKTSATSESKNFDSDGKFESHSKSVYTFDADENIIETVVENYDENGNKIN